MKLDLSLLVASLLALSAACGNNAYRCKNPDTSIADNWEKTLSCCNSIDASTTPSPNLQYNSRLKVKIEMDLKVP